jgi:hypothetical protein
MRPRRFDLSARLPVSRIVTAESRRRVDNVAARAAGAPHSDGCGTTWRHQYQEVGRWLIDIEQRAS